MTQEIHTEEQSSTYLQTEEMTLLRDDATSIIEQIIEEQYRQLVERTTAKEEVTKRITEIFDTSLPIDSATGTPPLQSRVTEHRGVKEQSGSREHTSVGIKSQANTNISENLNISAGMVTSEEIQTQKKEETECQDQRNNIPIILQIAAEIMIALFLIWLLLTVCKVIKSFSKSN